ncbi:MAG TPA: aldo/keto reductase [Phaeodactylibacter sp.]|nr:aldo/keto reductase [Phaeodactylibacter sp.]
MPQPTTNLVLGTAMWGWTTPKARAFELLDLFYAEGFREIDGATNYPINKQPADFRKAEQILLEWIDAHRVSDLKVMMKVGSLNNMRTPDHNLSKSFLLMMLDEYQHAFQDNFDTFMLHWDNRADKSEIEETYEALQIAQERGCRIGLSGIKFPDVHAAVNEAFGLDPRIQMKHNLLQSDYERYAPFHGKRRFITYGINAGGIKLDPAAYHEDSSLRARGGDVSAPHPIVEPLQKAIAAANEQTGRPAVSSMNHCGMAFAYHHPEVAGILLGTSRPSQLQDSINFFRAMQRYDYSDFYEQLKGVNG